MEWLYLNSPHDVCGSVGGKKGGWMFEPSTRFHLFLPRAEDEKGNVVYLPHLLNLQAKKKKKKKKGKKKKKKRRRPS